MSEQAHWQEELTEAVRQLPQQPGVYKYYNQEQELIYVGKAKNLKKRVSSYFMNKNGYDKKTRTLVSHIRRLEYTVVNSEWEALLLENNFIKNYQPKFNILLKDDKTYPYICISNDPYPVIYSTRKLNKTKGRYFGPYSSVRTMNNVLDLCRKLFNIRTCELKLTDRNIQAGKFKVCLEYHIGNCKGPCENLQSQKEYNQNILEAENILKGDLKTPSNYLQQKMKNAALSYEFEAAAQIKKKLDLLDKYQSYSIISNVQVTTNLEVLTIVVDENYAYLNYLKIVAGNIHISQNYVVSKILDETEDEIFLHYLLHLGIFTEPTYKREIITNHETEIEIPQNISITIPRLGNKKKLLDFSLKNIQEEIKKREINLLHKVEEGNEVLKQLQKDLHLNQLPVHIECFDNSNIQGTNPVSAMVCFRNGKPFKKDYRHFKVKTIVGPNDFGTMKEVVYRRYKRLTEENTPLPQLIIIDGGKGQLGVACEALKEVGIYDQVAIISIAKRLEEIYFPGDEFPIHLGKKSLSLKIIQQLRDEAHRFGLKFHRNLRSKGALTISHKTKKGA